MNDLFLGFDLRVGPRLLTSFWADKRRRDFLLLPSVAVPLSFDRHVWPPFFSQGRFAGFHSAGDPWPDAAWPVRDRRDALGFIASYEEALLGYHEARKFLSDVWLIALELRDGVEDTWKLNSRDGVLAWPIPNFFPPRTACCKTRWQLLGFDVVDPALSALTNIELKEGDRCALQRFLPALNASHLLASYADAVDFREWSNKNMNHEAPWFIVEIYRVSAERANGLVDEG